MRFNEDIDNFDNNSTRINKGFSFNYYYKYIDNVRFGEDNKVYKYKNKVIDGIIIRVKIDYITMLIVAMVVSVEIFSFYQFYRIFAVDNTHKALLLFYFVFVSSVSAIMFIRRESEKLFNLIVALLFFGILAFLGV